MLSFTLHRRLGLVSYLISVMISDRFFSSLYFKIGTFFWVWSFEKGKFSGKKEKNSLNFSVTQQLRPIRYKLSSNTT